MIKVIKGKVYDIEKATYIAHYDIKENVCETLCLTNTKRWFIVREKDNENAIIIPMTKEDAKGWLIEFYQEYALNEYFPEED